MHKTTLLLLLFILSIFSSNIIQAAEIQEDNNNYYTFSPQKEYHEEEKKKKAKINTGPKIYSQYQGDFSKQWYKKHKYPNKYYLSLNLGYNFGVSATDVVNSQILYKDGICLVNAGCTTDTFTYAPNTTIEMDSDTLVDIDYDGDVSFSITGGIEIREKLRLEAEASLKELSYSSITQSDAAIANYNTVDQGAYVEPGPTVDTDSDDTEIKLSMISIMLSAYRDFNRDGTLRPYIGAGIGGTNVSTKGYDAIHLTYQFKLGTSYKLNKNMFFDFGATYFVMGDVDYDYVIKNDNGVNASDETVNYRFEHDLNVLSLGIGYRFIFDPPTG